MRVPRRKESLTGPTRSDAVSAYILAEADIVDKATRIDAETLPLRAHAQPRRLHSRPAARAWFNSEFAPYPSGCDKVRREPRLSKAPIAALMPQRNNREISKVPDRPPD